MNATAKVVVYTTSNCPYCHAAKDLFKSKHVPFKEIDVSKDKDFSQLVKRTGWKTVPQIFINEKMIGGFRELVNLDRKGELDSLLS